MYASNAEKMKAARDGLEVCDILSKILCGSQYTYKYSVAMAGNRFRVTYVAGEHSTTEPCTDAHISLFEFRP